MIKVLVIDDSVVFRSQISEALRGVPGVEVTGSAPSGRIALQKLEQNPVDVITLDMEMPEMDGLAVLKELKARKIKSKVIVFSSQTQRGAEKALDALRAGADDVVAKPSFDDGPKLSPAELIRQTLAPKVLQFKGVKDTQGHVGTAVTPEDLAQRHTTIKKGVVNNLAKVNIQSLRPNIIVIASSTGGPAALETIFSKLKGPFKVPILIAQHMPAVFTEILASRLSSVSGLVCREAKNGEKLMPGLVYVAPGDFHMELRGSGGETTISLNQNERRNSVRPAADYLFETAAELYGDKCLGIVLTGMGEDGLDGSIRIKERKGAVVIQNAASCVVFGMPGAVHAINLQDSSGDLEYVAHTIQKLGQ